MQKTPLLGLVVGVTLFFFWTCLLQVYLQKVMLEPKETMEEALECEQKSTAPSKAPESGGMDGFLQKQRVWGMKCNLEDL